MSTPPLEIAARMAVVRQWMEAPRFAALQAAVEAKLARETPTWA